MSQNLDKLKPKIEQRSCHICGNKDFEWGYINGAYQPGLFTTKWSSKRHLLASRKCLTCHNVQVFADAKTTQNLRWVGWVLTIVVLAFVFAPLCRNIDTILRAVFMILTGDMGSAGSTQIFP